MIGQERRGEIGNGGIRGMGIPAVSDRKRALFRIHTYWGTFRVTKRIFFLTIGLAVFFTLLNVKVLDLVEANNCLAILNLCHDLMGHRSQSNPNLSRRAPLPMVPIFAGNPSIRYVYYGSFPSGSIAYNTILGWKAIEYQCGVKVSFILALTRFRVLRVLQIHFFCHVFPNNHALNRWIHDCIGSQQD
jgi:hypothetical protein